jgi:hypothetical protein
MSEQEQEQPAEQPDEEQPTPDEPTPDEGEEGEEGEEGDAPEGDQHAQDATDEPSGAVGAVGEKELEKMFKRVDTANAAYSRKLGEIMGEEAGVLEPCPRCSEPFLGFIFPPLMKPVTAEQKTAVLVSVGESPPSVSEPDNFSRRCDNCAGWGRVLSGSRVNSEKTLTCISCKGRGWVAVGDERRVPSNNVSEVAPVNGASELPEPAPEVDPWGRGPTDPDYGKLPQYAGAR